jgi:hypothetical protein
MGRIVGVEALRFLASVVGRDREFEQGGGVGKGSRIEATFQVPHELSSRSIYMQT